MAQPQPDRPTEPDFVPQLEANQTMYDPDLDCDDADFMLMKIFYNISTNTF